MHILSTLLTLTFPHIKMILLLSQARCTLQLGFFLWGTLHKEFFLSLNNSDSCFHFCLGHLDFSFSLLLIRRSFWVFPVQQNFLFFLKHHYFCTPLSIVARCYVRALLCNQDIGKGTVLCMGGMNLIDHCSCPTGLLVCKLLLLICYNTPKPDYVLKWLHDHLMNTFRLSVIVTEKRHQQNISLDTAPFFSTKTELSLKSEL